MTPYEIYIFILCAIVFTALTALFSVLLTVIVRQQIRLMRCGQEDEAILREKAAEQNRKGCAWDILARLVSGLLCVAILGVFGATLYLKATENTYSADVPTLRVVQSGSMAQKRESNKYLFENGLDDQLQTFDLILTYAVPAEEELCLYDIVIYERDGVSVVHRIVGIEEPNEKHPNERHFLLQGDAVEFPDKFPVLYEQIRGIYRGERVPFVGSFVMFMQSPAGWLCVLLVLFSMVATPIVEKKILRAQDERYAILCPPKEEAEA